MGRKAPRKRLTCRVMACPTGASHAPERLSALRPPLDWVSEAKMQNPDAAMRARERDGLFEMVKNAPQAMFALILRSAHAKTFCKLERACARLER
jgi:hypothetical protein